MTEKANHLHDDGTLRIVQWGISVSRNRHSQTVLIEQHERPAVMAHAQGATGEGMLTNGLLGVDHIRLEAGAGFAPHIHPGHHLLIVTGGLGTITYDGRIYPTAAGQAYMVEGEVPHAVGAITTHTILAVGSPHRPVDSPDRMEPVGYQEILTASLPHLTCLICDLTAEYPETLAYHGCPHCPSHFEVDDDN